MKINMILLAGCLISLGACDESKYDLEQLVPEQYHKILRVNNGGKQELTLYDTNDDFVYTFSVVKTGGQPDQTATADIHVLTQEELDRKYSTPESVNYRKISEDSYSLDVSQVAFSVEDRYKLVHISLNQQSVKASMESEPDATWVLPIQVTSTTDSINAEMNSLFLQINEIVMPTMGFSSTLVNTKEYKYGEVSSISESIEFKLDTDNKWDIDCGFTVNEEYVNTYNSANGTSFRLLPQSVYSMVETISLPNGTTAAKLGVDINAGELEPGDYMLPVRISSVSQFKISPTANLYPLSIRILAPQLDRTGWTAEANSEELYGETSTNSGPAARVLDGVTSTFWHSKWQGGSLPMPYELIIDAKDTYTFAQFALLHRANYTDVGSGEFFVSTDGIDWTKVGNFTMKKEQSVQVFGVIPTEGRYFKVKINTSNRDTNCALAEIYAYGLK